MTINAVKGVTLGRREARSISVSPAVITLALSFLALVAFAVLFPSVLAPGDPLEGDPLAAYLPPSAQHPLGTDQIGRGIYTRIIHGAQFSISIGVFATVIGVLVGVLLGLLAGLVGGVIDEAVSRILDMIAAFPGILLAIVLISLLGGGVPTLIVALGFGSVPRYARIVRSETRLLRGAGFVEQAFTLGIHPVLLIVRHVLPHAVRAVPILATIGLGNAILAAASLSFIGLGPQPPSPEWGAMLADGRNYLATAPWISMFPGVAIVSVVLAVSLLGRHLEQRSATKLQL